MRMLPNLVVLSIIAVATGCVVPEVAYREIPGTIGGTVTGLAGTGLVLTANGGDDLSISADGDFAFTTPMQRGASYVVAVKRQPSSPAQLCTVEHGSGTAGDRVVTDVEVTCTVSTFRVGGSVTGLVGRGLVLRSGAGASLAVDADGAFMLPMPVASGARYDVTVEAQPSRPSQVCSVAGGTGTIEASDVTSVAVSCVTSRFTIGGTVTGLAGTGLVLQNHDGDDLVIGANGSFTFATPAASGATFAVTVASQPSQPTQTCSVTDGVGSVATEHVTSVVITCATQAFTIGGTVTGLLGASLVLQNNGGDDLAITGDGDFTFASPVASGATFEVAVRTQPSQPTQTCTVAGATGAVGGAAVTSIAINCATDRFMIGGTISGLAGTVILQNNVGDDLTISSNGSFAFATPVPSGATYNVTVRTQPAAPSQTCAVANRTGTVGSRNVTNIAVTCTTSLFSIGGTVSGLAPGNSITLRNNGGNDLVRSASGGFTFTAPIASGQAYAVTIVADPLSPVAQTCTVATGAGTVGSANVTNVAVTCVTRTFSIGGSISGVTGSSAVTLQLDGGATLVAGNGDFAFSTPVASGASYSVTVVSSPLGRTCSVVNGAGTVRASNVTNVLVTCVGVPPSTGSFFYAASATASATQNTTNFEILVVAGQTLSIGTCIVPGASGQGDTFLRLFDASNAEVAFNDDVPGVAECAPLLTHFIFTATATQTFQVRAGCFQDLACSGTVAYTLSGT